MSEKRKCIFTGKIADTSLKILKNAQDRHNWARSVPCNAEFAKILKKRNLNDLEFKLVELFYKQELLKLKINLYEEKSEAIRKIIADKTYVSDEKYDDELISSKDILQEKQIFSLPKEESSDNMEQTDNQKKNNLWD